ncbi:MAG: hypothetical protein WA775_04055 [Psychroserpens sp.]|uniref:hypothetical protein n=1 Tax=Psychroserpens sp. TaxID=2020870 RepID=UPI003CB39A9A
MKKFIYPILLLVVATFTLQSCDKDDDDGGSSSSEGEVTIDGTQFQLDGNSFLINYGENSDGSYNWDIEIEGENIDVYFELHTNSVSGLTSGTYNYSNESAEFTYTIADFETVIDNQFTIFDATEGTVILDVDGDDVDIDFNLISEDGETIAGNWSGRFTVIDADE